jgi:dienelactone hydrolase
LSVTQPPIVLVGHSMGGAVAVRCAASKVHAAILHPTAATQQLTHVAQGTSGHCNRVSGDESILGGGDTVSI